MSTSILLIGGCSEGQEAGALRSIEELTFRRSFSGLEAHSRVVGQLREVRRSPAVLYENNGVLIVGGCKEKGCHLSSCERISKINDDWESSPALQCSILERRSCTSFSNLDDSTGVIVGGFNGIDCLKTVELIKMNEEKISSTKLDDLPFRLKNGVAVPLGDDGILLFGGWDECRTMKTVFRLCMCKHRDTYQVNMDAILPYAVEGHCCAFHNGYVYIIGGYDGVSVVDTVIRYSVDKKTSEVLPVRLSIARENHTSEVVFDCYIIVMAGWNGRHSLDSVEVFEITDQYPYLLSVHMNLTLAQARNRPASLMY